MFARLSGWLDNRTTFRKLLDALLLEHIPGGARWRYVWGSCLSFVFTIQLVTGILLMTSYSAGDSTAWSSVWYIQYQMDFGWFIRGLHHFGSQTMVVLLALHMLQVVIAGAQLPPREINWWLGLGLMGVVLALSLTGYLLPWDQKGYWATQVATNIARSLPVLGPWLQQVVVGGPEYGHSTLTRFYALHVGILPPLLIALLIAHIAVFRKHGVTAPRDAQGTGWFWPDQAFRDLLVSLIIFGIMIALVLHGHGHKTEPAADKWSYDYWAHAGRDGLGANLDSPADPSNAYPARPEWYFLFLFQLLKYFKGDLKILGTVVIPNGAAVLLLLLPLLGYGRMRRLGHIVGVVVVVGLLTAVARLTLLAVADDTVYPLAHSTIVRVADYLVPALGLLLLLLLALVAVLPRGVARTAVGGLGWLVLLAVAGGAGAVTYWSLETDKQFLEHTRSGQTGPFDDIHIPRPVVEWVSKDMTEAENAPREGTAKFQQELTEAGELAHRSVNAARGGIPAPGPLSMLHGDPVTRGPKLFKENCAICHTHGKDFKVDNPTASDLSGFGTKEWISGLLRKPEDPGYFGRTKLKEMRNWVHRTRQAAQDKGQQDQLEEDFDAVAEWLASHPRPDNTRPQDVALAAKIDWGHKVYQARCADCHTYDGKGTAKGPDFTGYGDAEWLRLMMMAPDHTLRYPDEGKNAMPAFRNLVGPGSELTRLELAEKEKDPMNKTKVIHLADLDRELIIRWVLKDPNVVFGGTPIVPSPQKR